MQNPEKKLNSIQSIMANDSEILLALSHHSAKINKLQAIIQEHLHEPLCQYVAVANFTRDVIILHASNAAWATKLRYSIPEILSIARIHGDLPDLQSVRIKVIPEQQNTPVQNRKLELSDNSRTIIHEIAETIDSEDLRSALLRLLKP